jgi:hypothetical protein
VHPIPLHFVFNIGLFFVAKHISVAVMLHSRLLQRVMRRPEPHVHFGLLTSFQLEGLVFILLTNMPRSFRRAWVVLLAFLNSDIAE